LVTSVHVPGTVYNSCLRFAISGFHSLVSSGTTSKQLDKETDAKPIAYGGMLLECVLAVLTLCAIGYAYKWNAVHPDQALKGATAIFGGGIAHMIDDIIPGSYSILNSLLVLTYSAFCLTSLDTATRLARFMFQEFWLEPGETAADIKEGWKKVMVNPYFATILTVVLGILLGMNGYGKIWGLFGAANQLLAGIGLLALPHGSETGQKTQDVPDPDGIHDHRYDHLPCTHS